MSEYLAILAFIPAMQSTKAMFWPLRPGQLFRLLIISFFIGAWITSPVPQDISFTDIPYLSNLPGAGSMPPETGLITAVMTGFLALLFVYALFSSIFQFIFVDYLSSHTDRILTSFISRIGMGIRLLGFYLVTILIIGLCSIIAIALIAIPVLISNPENPAIFFMALIYTLFGLLILIIPVWILTIITTDFVVPVMIVHDCGIIRGWKIIWNELSGRWDETGLYLSIKIGINILTGIILGLLLVGIMEIFGLSSLMLIPGLQTSESFSLVNFCFSFILIGFITLVVMTPVVTFLRYYALIFLQYLSETYALLPEVFGNREKVL